MNKSWGNINYLKDIINSIEITPKGSLYKNDLKKIISDLSIFLESIESSKSSLKEISDLILILSNILKMIKEWNLINPKSKKTIPFYKYVLMTKKNLSEVEFYEYNNYDFKKTNSRGLFIDCQNAIVI